MTFVSLLGDACRGCAAFFSLEVTVSAVHFISEVTELLMKTVLSHLSPKVRGRPWRFGSDALSTKFPHQAAKLAIRSTPQLNVAQVRFSLF